MSWSGGGDWPGAGGRGLRTTQSVESKASLRTDLGQSSLGEAVGAEVLWVHRGAGRQKLERVSMDNSSEICYKGNEIKENVRGYCKWILYQLSHKGSPRILEWVAYPFSRESSQPRDQTQISHIEGRFFPSEPPGKPKNTAVGNLCLLQGSSQPRDQTKSSALQADSLPAELLGKPCPSENQLLHI